MKVPVVMITKNEAENLMEEAIGSQIDDYLIIPNGMNSTFTGGKWVWNSRYRRRKLNFGAFT